MQNHYTEKGESERGDGGREEGTEEEERMRAQKQHKSSYSFQLSDDQIFFFLAI